MTAQATSNATRLLREIRATHGPVYLYRRYGGYRAGLRAGLPGYVCPKQPTAADAVRFLWDWLRR